MKLREQIASARDEWARLRHARRVAALYESQWARSASRKALKIILGGDLNASIQFDVKQKNQSHRIFFQRLEDFGLVDCQGTFTNERPRTLRHRRSDFPWANDYIFVSESLAKKVIAHQVVEQPEMLDLSDHNPVVVTFDA